MHSDSLDLHIIIHSRCFITFALRKCTIYMGIHMFNMHMASHFVHFMQLMMRLFGLPLS